MRALSILLHALLCCGLAKALADDGQIRFFESDGAPHIQVVGDKDDDWSFQVSSDLLNWVDEPALGTLLSGGTATGPSRLFGGFGADHRFYRARQTQGLYDPAALRTISLTFTQP